MTLNLPKLENLTDLDLSGIGINNLVTSRLPNLLLLICNGENIETLDLTANKKLSVLDCQSASKLASLTINKESPLSAIYCNRTNIGNLDLSGLKNLQTVECKSNNNLKYLNVSNCPIVNSIDCTGSNLDVIDVRGCPKINGQNLTLNPKNYPTIFEDPDEPDYDYSVRGVADSYWQTDSSVQPKPVLKYGTYTLKEGKDYTITYKTDASGTKGTMTIKGKGIFAGVNKTVHYKIKPADSMKRLYNPNSGEHFYTSSDYEKSSLVRLGWRDESVGWTSPKTSNSPVYRLYNPNAGDHHYTKNASEKDMLVSRGWRYEGVAFYSSDDQKNGVPIYRQYNPNAKSGAHNYTSNRAEHDRLVRLGWRDEGIAWYGVDTTK